MPTSFYDPARSEKDIGGSDGFPSPSKAAEKKAKAGFFNAP
jgi:hypothetical protein